MNGRDDLASAVELDLIADALPEQRFFVWKLKAALLTRGARERLRNRRRPRAYRGMTERIRYLGAAWGRDEAAGRVERQSRGTMATERAEQRPGADLALIVTIFEAGEPGEV